MMQTNPYVFFDGDCEAALKFYAAALGGTIDTVMTYAGSPAEATVPADWRNKILHARLSVGGTVIMASDAPPGRYHKPQGLGLTLMTAKEDEAERAFQALAQGGAVGMPMEKTFFAKRFGMVVDRFAVPWMIVCE